ncbi:hypothetical protein JP09_005835 [Dehalogenimonas etheniformans]|uniref:Uncharacterized protein n=1 Tax=Dehalogenimonas etheniformans TaxID=1536648 RepID=A0A2P5P7P6_9CHLR|nr:hypothetical protein JP09_005835 [Dehalogenimonas etheniformans]
MPEANSKSFWKVNRSKLVLAGVIISLITAALFGQLMRNHPGYEKYLSQANPKAQKLASHDQNKSFPHGRPVNSPCFTIMKS